MENKGLYAKYDVRKMETGEPVDNCFVLQPDKDGAALAALRKYAEATSNKQLSEDINNWLDSIIYEKTKDLKAFAIGPDSYEVVVGYDKESAVAWYKQNSGISEDEWVEYEVNDYPMDKPFKVEAGNGIGFEMTTVRQFVAHVKEFPCIAWWSE